MGACAKKKQQQKKNLHVMVSALCPASKGLEGRLLS